MNSVMIKLTSCRVNVPCHRSIEAFPGKSTKQTRAEVVYEILESRLRDSDQLELGNGGVVGR